MLETAAEFDELQALLDRSIEGAGAFIRESLQMPEKSLSASQLLKYWDGLLTAAVAHSTAKGNPRVAPTGVMLVHGRFIVPTVLAAARAQAVTRRPALSISRFDEGDVCVIAHGVVAVVREREPMFEEFADLQRRLGNGRSVLDWGGEGVYLSLVPDLLYTFARYPERFPA